MNKLTIAAAQTGAEKGDIETNVRTHCEFTKTAIKNEVDIIIFPELSLTGYEPDIVRENTMDLHDKRLLPLKKLVRDFGITIVAGAPVPCPSEKPYLGALVLHPENSFIYLKQHLHTGEEQYFSSVPDRSGHVVTVKDEKIGIAICADVEHASHPAAAAFSGATIYAAGVLMLGGYANAAKQMQQYAKTHQMAALMADYGSPTGGYIPAGQSAIWDANGDLIAVAGKNGDALVVGMKINEKWQGKVVRL